jgi:acetoin:2,6-dichlorophenolindophenol oxidoreductase subunit alpha
MSDGWDRLLAPMLRARRFDELLVENAALVDGVFHVSIGLEATAGALAWVRSDADSVMLGHRNHAHLVAIGSAPELLYRELLGRDGGPQRGRAGSFHLADPPRGVAYTSAMLGGAAALAAGLALAKQRLGEPGVALAFFGDGAMGEGLIYETFNLAAAWRLPVVFVCENNGDATGAGAFSTIAEAHDIASTTADGRRPRETLAALQAASGAARQPGGAHFLEVVSEPWPGNSTFRAHPLPRLDFGTVRADAGDAFAAGDPVRAEARALLADGIELECLIELDAAITDRMTQAFAAAARAPLAPAVTALEAVWSDS